MKYFRRILLFLFLIAMCSTLVLATDTLTAVDEEADENAMLVLGDSYSASHKLASSALGWPQQVADKFGLVLYNHAISGSSFAGGPKGNHPMIDRYLNIPDRNYTLIILQGGSNDWSHHIPIGTYDSRDETTMLGAMNVMLDYFEEKWPEATIVCFTPWVSTGARNALDLDTTDYSEAMLRLCKRRDILCYDATNTAVNGIYMNQQWFRSRYCLAPSDRWHLNAEGQTFFAASFTKWLNASLYGITTADRFYDMQNADMTLKNSVSLLYDKGIMQGTTDGLFSPTQAATRRTLAMTLYRIAGSPKTSELSFADVAYDDSGYYAICWAVSKGLMEADESGFHPDSKLHREELVLTLYAYYTQVAKRNIARLSSLTQYPDSDSIPREHHMAWGWVLGEKLLVLPEQLQTDALVSRGQLATALATMLQIPAL